MAKKFENEQGFLVIEMSREEADSIGFGIGGGACICLVCNEFCTPNVYYVAVLNETMCKECLEEFLAANSRYEEDMSYETRNYERYAKQLGL